MLVNHALADPRGGRALLGRLGWDVPPGSEDIGLAALDLSGVVTAVTSLDVVRATGTASDTELASAVAEVIFAVADALITLRQLPTAFDADNDYLEATRIVDEFLPRLADLALIASVMSAVPMAAAIAQLCGVFVLEQLPARPAVFQVEHLRHEVRWDRLGGLVTDPGSVFRDVYGWGTADFQGQVLLANLANVLQFMTDRITARDLPERLQAQLGGVPADGRPVLQLMLSLLNDPPTGRDIGLTLFELPPTAAGAVDGGLGVAPYTLGTDELTIPLADGVTLLLETSVSVSGGTALLLRPDQPPMFRVNLITEPAASAADDDQLVVTVRFARGPDRPVPLLSLPGGAALEASTFIVGGGLRSRDPSGFLMFTTTGARLVVPAAQADAFMAQLLGDRDLDMSFDLGLEWSPTRGLTLQGSGGMSTTLSLNFVVGPLRLRELMISLLAAADDLVFRAVVQGSATLGPVAVAFDGVGLRATVAFRDGNLGPVDLSAGIQTPSALGLTVAAGPVSGAGFVGYDEDTGRYSGALDLRLQQVNVRAVGVLDTRLPGGQRGFSLLVMLSARFTPGIQLGFGITLTGVGGLVGVNRRIDVDALRERFATGTAARILAPEDPLRNLPAVLTELSAVFPPADGIFVVGPTLQLQWAKLVTLDVGVFFEFPGPNRVVVLGTARATIDHPRASGPLLRLRCDFVGVLDLAQRTFAFDAVLLDSRLMESFPITGGLMVRAGWGDAPYVLFSVGGFHPDFAPGSLVLPKTLTRLAMSSGSPDDALYLRFEGYFAITPNTVQFGAAVEVAVELGPFRVRGFLGFDALIRFEPFFFQISFEAGMRLEWRGRTLAGITVSGTLSGPGPVRFTGRACIELLFFDICGSASFELGSDAPPTVSPVSSAVERDRRRAAPAGQPAGRRRGSERSPCAALPVSTRPCSPRPASSGNRPARRWACCWSGSRAPRWAGPRGRGQRRRGLRRGTGLVRAGQLRRAERRRGADPSVVRAAAVRGTARGRRRRPLRRACTHEVDGGGVPDPAAAAAVRSASGVRGARLADGGRAGARGPLQRPAAVTRRSWSATSNGKSSTLLGQPLASASEAQAHQLARARRAQSRYRPATSSPCDM